MRDTSLLRLRLHSALALAAGLGLGACGGPAPTPTPTKAVATADSQPRPAAAATPMRPPTPDPPPYTSPYPARTGQDPLDPDGVEEEGCPNGDWCGPPSAAEKLRARIATDEMGCPTRLQGTAKPIEDKLLKGLSQNPMMQGRLRKIATAEQRKATGNDTTCCYHWFDYCSGRPLLDDELAGVRAPLVPGDTWLLGHVPEVSALDPAARAALAGLWQADARDEHASVAAFARATLELLAVGAPPDLVAASQQASLDEIRHARACLTIAAAYAAPREPGPLPALAPRDGGLVALACNTFLEGCVGETIAAIAARRAARRCEVDPIRDALLEIAEDEARHAELAWATVAWAVRTGGPDVAAALRALAAELLAHPTSEATDQGPDALAPAVLAAHGRLPAQALATARSDAWDDVIAPTLALILG
jgi:hypothetical protein